MISSAAFQYPIHSPWIRLPFNEMSALLTWQQTFSVTWVRFIAPLSDSWNVFQWSLGVWDMESQLYNHFKSYEILILDHLYGGYPEWMRKVWLKPLQFLALQRRFGPIYIIWLRKGMRGWLGSFAVLNTIYLGWTFIHKERWNIGHRSGKRFQTLTNELPVQKWLMYIWLKFLIHQE